MMCQRNNRSRGCNGRIITMVIIFLSLVNYIDAQSITDTVLHIPDVLVSAPRNEYFREDIKTEDFRLTELRSFSGHSLGHFLAANTALNIRSYGPGGSASSVSMRGASASHVQVNWNGLPVNSVTLGSYDFSMIPAAGFDKVSVVYGAPGALYGSGTFGGAVNLENDLNTGKELSGNVFLGYQSLKALSSAASLSLAGEKAAWKMSAWGASSRNEFSYYDYIRQTREKQTDGGWNDYGMIHSLLLQLTSRSSLETGLWYQSKSFDIPSRIGSTSFEHQSDSTLKFYVGYKYIVNGWSIKVKAARFSDRQNYYQKPSAESAINTIDTRIASNQNYGDIEFRYYPAGKLSFDAGLSGSLLSANVSTYGSVRRESGLAVFTGLKYSNDNLIIQALVREEWNSSFGSAFLPSLGFYLEPVNDRLKIRANYSKKFRKPTFNDLYWMPGGNPDLHPETGYTIETGTEIVLYNSTGAKLYGDASLYYSRINNMIVWRPNGAFWSPDNYHRINSAGMDIALKTDLKQQSWSLHSALKIMINKSMQSQAGKDEIMLYSPPVITSWVNRFTSGIFDLTISHHFTSARLYSEERNLDPYNLFNISTGVKLALGKGDLGIHANLDNLTGESYELIRLYPMPGRYWNLKLDYSFKYAK